mmetsp:Transcript_39895/g.98650  ORF Transcript_39895/g.98650 Transcript_39895/m.98650 type:complete len:95 (-) Transcript_39895:200-484(-)
MRASSGGHAGCVRLLLAAWADVNYARADGYTALMAATDRGHVDCGRLMLERATHTRGGADVNHVGPFGVTTLIEASHFGHTGCVRLLLEVGRRC